MVKKTCLSSHTSARNRPTVERLAHLTTMWTVCISQVQFEVADVTKREFAAESFDVIFSRDTILHIEDKHKLFSSFYVSMVDLQVVGAVTGS